MTGNRDCVTPPTGPLLEPRLESQDGPRLVAPLVPVPANDDDDVPPPSRPASGALAIPVEPESDDLVAAVQPLMEGLPRLNEQIMAGAVGADDLAKVAAAALPIVPVLKAIKADAVDEARARRLIQPMQLVASSLEAHVQQAAAQEGGREAAEDVAGDGLRLVPGLDEALISLSRLAQVPPALSATTLWLENPGHRLSFTTAHHERFFAAAVRETHNVFGRRIPQLLGPLMDGLVEFDSASAAMRLQAAADRAEALYRRFYAFPRKTEAGHRNMEPQYFMRVLRRFLVPHRIGGHLFEGPNATYTPGMPRMDFALGLRPPFYVDVVLGRLRHMAPEHRAMIERDLSRPSIRDRFMDALGLPRHGDVDAQSIRTLAESRPQLAEAKAHLGRLASAVDRISRLHFGLITLNLKRPAEALSRDERAKIVPSPDAGVGGNALSATARIREMRSSDPFMAALIASAETDGSAE